MCSVFLVFTESWDIRGQIMYLGNYNSTVGENLGSVGQLLAMPAQLISNNLLSAVIHLYNDLGPFYIFLVICTSFVGEREKKKILSSSLHFPFVLRHVFGRLEYIALTS